MMSENRARGGYKHFGNNGKACARDGVEYSTEPAKREDGDVPCSRQRELREEDMWEYAIMR